MNKYDVYKGDYIPESTLDGIQNNADNAMKNRFVTQPGLGIQSGLGVTQNPGGANLKMQVDAGLAYDHDGEHVLVPVPQLKDCEFDYLGNPTTVGTGGWHRWITIFAHYQTADSDQRVDDDGVALNYIHAESYTLRVVRGAEHATTPVRPSAVDASDVLVADIYVDIGDVAFLDADVDYTRREELIGERVRRISDGHVEPDEVQIAADYDTAAHVTATRDYGGEVMESYDRHGRRLPGEVFEFADDFMGTTLSDIWTVTNSVGGTFNGGTAMPMGCWNLQASNGGAPADWISMETEKIFGGNQRVSAVFDLALLSAADAEHEIYFGVMEQNDKYLVDKGYGFYRKAGNIFARTHDGANFHDVDCALGAAAMTVPKRFEIHPVMLDNGTFVRVLFFVDGVQVANIVANLPAMTGELVTPRISIYCPAGRTAHREVVIDRIAVVASRTYVP